MASPWSATGGDRCATRGKDLLDARARIVERYHQWLWARGPRMLHGDNELAVALTGHALVVVRRLTVGWQIRVYCGDDIAAGDEDAPVVGKLVEEPGHLGNGLGNLGALLWAQRRVEQWCAIFMMSHSSRSPLPW